MVRTTPSTTAESSSSSRKLEAVMGGRKDIKPNPGNHGGRANKQHRNDFVKGSLRQTEIVKEKNFEKRNESAFSKQNMNQTNLSTEKTGATMMQQSVPKRVQEIFALLRMNTASPEERQQRTRRLVKDLRVVSQENNQQKSNRLYEKVFTQKLEDWQTHKRDIADFGGMTHEKGKSKNHRSLARLRTRDQIFATLQKLYADKIAVKKRPDIDSLAAVYILKLCKFLPFDSVVQEVDHGQLAKGHLHIDCSNESGVLIKNYKKDSDGKQIESLFNTEAIIDANKTLLVDGQEFYGASSATQMVYAILEKLGKIPSNLGGQIKRFVDFVNIIDMAGYEVAGRDYKYMHRTLFGLQKLILKDKRNIGYMFHYFGENPSHTGFEVLDDTYLNSIHVYGAQHEYQSKDSKKEGKVSLKVISERREKGLQKSAEYMDTLLDNDMYLPASALLKREEQHGFVVDIEGKLTNPAETATMQGMGVVKHMGSTLYIYSRTVLPYDTFAKFGKVIRGHTLLIDVASIKSVDDLLQELFPKERAEVPAYQSLKSSIEKWQQDNATVEKKGFEQKKKDYMETFAERASIEEGKEYYGLVNNIFRYGVFVDLSSGETGLIHKNEVAKAGLQKLAVGDVVQVVVNEVKSGEGGKRMYKLRLL